MINENIQLNAVELATELTIAWLSNSNTRTSADEVPAFLARMHSSVQSLMSAYLCDRFFHRTVQIVGPTSPSGGGNEFLQVFDGAWPRALNSQRADFA